MSDQGRRFLFPSLANEAQAQVSGLLKSFLWVFIGIIAVYGLVMVLVDAHLYLPLVFGFHLPTILALIFAFVLAQRKRNRAAQRLMLAALWVGITVAFLMIGGIQAATFTGAYVLLIIIAGIFEGYRGALLSALVNMVTALTMALLRHYNWIPGPDQRISIFVSWLGQALLMFGAAELLRVATINIGFTFDRSRREQKYFRSLIENSSDMVAVADALGKIQYLSPSVERILGYTLEELKGHNAFDLIHNDDRGSVMTQFARLIVHPGGREMAEFRLHSARGEWLWVEAAASNFLLDPDVQGVIVNYRDVSERKLQEARLAHDSIHDALTGLPNRTLFTDRVTIRLRRAARDFAHNFAVLVLDIDHFKNINDSLGHAAGDKLLLDVARRLESCLRTSDTIARLGGDEFGILLDETDGKPGAELTAGRILASLSQPLSLGGTELLPTASLGVVVGSTHCIRAEDYLRDAEIAMYRAKSLGRAKYVLFQDRMREGVLERVGLEAELRRALLQGEFRVFYQPVYTLQNGMLAGFEALVRWEHPQRGLLLPGAFIDVAEECGIVVELDRWVMREACRQMRNWHNQFPSANLLIINVNLSRRQLTRGDLVPAVRQILAETGLDASCLRPEFTESLIMENVEEAKVILSALEGLGVRVEIDDFGTGQSSLVVLAELEGVRTLKIDRAFIQDIDVSEVRVEIVRSILALGTALKKEVIAEGIETEAQLEQLRRLGCEYGQGFLFSRGVSSQDAAGLIHISEGK